MDGEIASRAAATMTRGHRLVFNLADHNDEAELRALVRETPLGGAIETTLRREPDYFDGAAVEGPFHQVIAARAGEAGPIVGMATRSVRMRYVDGEPLPVGYLGGLRLHPDVRNGLVLARGFRKLREIHEDGRTDFYLTTVTEGNRVAIESLTRGRVGLPTYHELGRYLTFMLPTRSWRMPQAVAGLTVRPLAATELPQMLTFLNNEGSERTFFPYLTTDDFVGAGSTYRGLSFEHILCAWRDGKIVGTLAGWDQLSFKQSIVERYHGHWKWSRHLYNLLARCAGLPRFPRPGDRLRSLTLALPVVADSDRVVWQALLREVRQLPVTRRNDSLALGLFERDPLVPFARRSSVYCYRTRLFIVCRDRDRVLPERFDGRNVYLELGCL